MLKRRKKEEERIMIIMMKGRAREDKGEEAGEVARCQLREGLPGHRLGQDLHLTKINVAPVWMVEWKKNKTAGTHSWKAVGRPWGPFSED